MPILSSSLVESTCFFHDGRNEYMVVEGGVLEGMNDMRIVSISSQ